MAKNKRLKPLTPKRKRMTISDAADALLDVMHEEDAQKAMAEQHLKDALYQALARLNRAEARIEDLEFRTANSGKRPGQDRDFDILVGPGANA
jgi:hypothetical protein